MKTFKLDPEWSTCRVFDCGHVQHACCVDCLDGTCPLCNTYDYVQDCEEWQIADEWRGTDPDTGEFVCFSRGSSGR